MVEAVLVVMAGRPGTGKTTLARLIARDLRAGVIRTDTIATVLMTSGLTAEPSTAGSVTYDVAIRVTGEMLEVGTPVVIDGVHATHERRRRWVRLAGELAVRVRFLETFLPDPDEHRRRVENRTADVPGLIVPSWELVERQPYDDWVDSIDGPRLLVDMTDARAALPGALDYASARTLSHG